MALSDDAADRLVRAQAALIQLLARAAFAKMWRALGEDSALSPRDAIQAAQADFGGAFARALAGAFSELLQRSVGVAEVRAMPVGDIALSQRLHRHDAQTLAEVLQAIKAHAQGVHQARELALALYDGYSPAQGPKRPLEGRSRADLPRYLRELTNDPEARQSLARVIEQGQAQAARLKSAPLRAAYTEALDAWEAGAGREALKRRLEIAQREKNRFFANRIAQTELARAHQADVAAELMADESIDVVQVRINPAHPRTDICDFHARADLFGLGPGNYPKAKAPRPPFHPHCLPGDTLVTSAGKITAATKRWFDGDVSVITTASGKRLTATINHPVLTARGWVPAGLVDVGDEVIARVVPVDVWIGVDANNKHQDVPTRISEIADTFLSSSEVAAREVPTSAEDFHGDGMAGNVAVVGANRELWDGVDAASAKILHDARFQRAHAGESALLGDGGLHKALEVFRNSANSVMRRLCHGGPPLGPDAIKADQVLLTDGADHHPGFHEPLGDSRAADTALARQIQDGATGPVFADKVINIERHAFSGHVYNLETETGHFTCNNIITHNCYCKLKPKYSLDAAGAREIPRGVAAYLRSMPADEAARVMGSRQRLQRVLDGASVDSVINAGVDPLYRLARLGDPGAGHALVENAGMAVDAATFGSWARQVAGPMYLAKHEFVAVASLPKFVLSDTDVARLRPIGSTVYISDFQLRHSLRPSKAARNAALPIEVAADLPARLAAARWAFDKTHDGVIAFFDAGVPGRIGKAVVHFNHVRRGHKYNAVLTTGLVNPENESEREYRSLKKPKA